MGLYWGFTGIMENVLWLYRGYIGILWGLYWGCIGIMENRNGNYYSGFSV